MRSAAFALLCSVQLAAAYNPHEIQQQRAPSLLTFVLARSRQPGCRP